MAHKHYYIHYCLVWMLINAQKSAQKTLKTLAQGFGRFYDHY